MTPAIAFTIFGIYLLGVIIYQLNKSRPETTVKEIKPEEPVFSDLTVCQFCAHPYKYDIHYYCPKCFRDKEGLFPKDNIEKYRRL